MKEFYQMPQVKKEEIKRKIADFLRRQNNVSFAYIFGSFLDKENIFFRDIDVAVFLKPFVVGKESAFNYEIEMAIQLGENLALPMDIFDVKILNFAPESFLNNVFCRGELLFAKNEEMLYNLIENTSSERLINEYISDLSFKELISA